MKILRRSLLEFVFRFLPFFFPSFKNTRLSYGNTGITMLLCHRDVFPVIYTVSSLFYFLGFSLPVHVVGDGTLSRADKRRLSRHFDILFSDSAHFERKIKDMLKPYKTVSKYRFSPDTFILKKKLLDANLLHPFDSFILLDADFLFAKHPVEIVRWLTAKNKRFFYGTHHWRTGSAEEDPEIIVRRLLYARFPSSLDRYYSGGLMGIPGKRFINLPYLEKIISFFYTVGMENRWLAESHIYPLLFGKGKVQLLPREKYINIWLKEQYHEPEIRSATSVHYAGENKSRFKLDAVKLALTTRFFRS